MHPQIRRRLKYSMNRTSPLLSVAWSVRRSRPANMKTGAEMASAMMYCPVVASPAWSHSNAISPSWQTATSALPRNVHAKFTFNESGDSRRGGFSEGGSADESVMCTLIQFRH